MSIKIQYNHCKADRIWYEIKSMKLQLHSIPQSEDKKRAKIATTTTTATA